MVILMTVAYMFSFIDRYILGLLIDPIKADLGLSDTQIGLLLGPAFAIFYATMGLPLGYLADRVKRVWIVAVGVFVWSLATVASGFAQKFSQLFIARMGVGIGEATLSPCAISMITDSFPEKERGKPIGFYTMGMSLGAGFAGLSGAAVLMLAESVDLFNLPIIGEISRWQLAFIIVGLPGILLAFLIAALKEPQRTSNKNQNAEEEIKITEALKFFIEKRSALGSFILPACVMTIIAYSHAWLAPMFERTWDMPPSTYAFINGLLLLVFGPLSNNSAGWLADRLVKQGKKDGGLRVVILGAFIFLPTAILAPLVPNPTLCFMMLSINTIGIAFTSSSALIALVRIVPSKIRGLSTAFYLMCISITGLLLGPTSVGLLNDFVFEADNVRYSMSTIPLIFGIPVLTMIPFMRRSYLKEIEKT
jgi:MFS family permease